MKRANMNCELSDEEMRAVTGGNHIDCPFIGFGTGNAFCFFFGETSDGNIHIVCMLCGGADW